MPLRVSIRDAHSDQVAGLVIDGVADLGFALTAGTPRGLIRVPLSPDDVVCAAAPNHPIQRVRRASVSDLKRCLIAVNAWGDGASEFLSKLAQAGTEDWRIRLCADATTALALARDHDHIALVARSAVGSVQGIEVIRLAGLGRWVIRLDLLYRRAERANPVIKAVSEALQTA
jgi:DNA-binding transcriptional LysR family regulator